MAGDIDNDDVIESYAKASVCMWVSVPVCVLCMHSRSIYASITALPPPTQFFHLLLVLVPDTRGVVEGLGGAAGVCASNWRVRLVELALASDWFFGRRPSFIFHSLTSFYRP